MSTVTLPTDTEAPIITGPSTQQTYEQTDAGLDPGPSARRPKRQRDLEGEWGGSDDDGDDYLPYKKAKLSRPSTRAIHAVWKSSIWTATAPNVHFVVQTRSMPSVTGGTSDRPLSDRSRKQRNINTRKTTLRRRLMKATSEATVVSGTSLAVTRPQVCVFPRRIHELLTYCPLGGRTNCLEVL